MGTEWEVKTDKVVFTRKVMDLPATWSLVREMGVPETGGCQSSTRPRTSRAERVSGACADGAGPPWCGTEDKPTLGYSDLKWLGHQQIGHGLIDCQGLTQAEDQWLSWLYMKQAPGGVDFGWTLLGWD